VGNSEAFIFDDREKVPCILATSASRASQIIGTVGNPCPTPQTSRKIERQVQRDQTCQEDAVFRGSQEAKSASTCTNMIIIIG